MGMMFGLLFLLLLVAGSFILTVIYGSVQLFTKQPASGRALGCIWSLPLGFLGFLLFGFLLLACSPSCERMPMNRRVSPDDVFGTYRIDRNFYPGKNADWQYEHIKFTITPEDKLVLTEIDDRGIAHQYTGKVIWSDIETRRALWSANLNEKHHLRVGSPTLYRSYFHFYYVIHSDKYGNMFFRRESDYPVYEFGFSLLAIPLVWYWKYRKRHTADSLSAESS